MNMALRAAIAFFGLYALCGAGDASRWPRHLLFSVGVTNSTESDVLVGGGMTGGQTAHSGAGSLATGSVVVDVVGFTPDGALRMQVQETTDTRSVPKVNVDVTSDGMVRVLPDQADNITEEERMLLQTLAQNFVTDDNITNGKWSQHAGSGNSSVDENYKVTSADPNGVVHIAMEQRIVMRNVSPYDTTAHADLTYNSHFKVPVTIVMDSRTHSEGIQETATRDLKFHFELKVDSWEASHT